MADESSVVLQEQVAVASRNGEIKVALRDAIANPAPLGLMAFGMTTVMLNLANAGVIALSSIILAMGVFYGGIAQIIAGVMEYKKNNTFGATAFCSYGSFWLTFVGLIVFPKWMGIAAPTENAIGWYLFAWGVFTVLMFVGTLRINRSLQTVFASLAILYFLLALSKWTGSSGLGKVAGWEGIFVGLSAVYASIGNVWNELYGKVVLSLGPARITSAGRACRPRVRRRAYRRHRRGVSLFEAAGRG
jgi:succinate-acetate transporter protein